MSDDPEKKIVVDDDWKEQVRKEREELRKKKKDVENEDPSDDSQPSTESEAEVGGTDGTDGANVKPPPASIEGLISMLATQAMVSMGVMPGAGGEGKVDREFAKHFIDLLGILEEKTQGNLSADEAKMLTQVLHDLRMGFVQLG